LIGNVEGRSRCSAHNFLDGMCGRYEVHTPVEEIARRFEARLTPDAAGLQPRYNVAPTLAVPVVRENADGRVLEAMTWGLVPSWAKVASGAKPINARAETVFDKPMFRNAIRRRRCLIPVDGFYEWQTGPLRKQPYHVGMIDDALFAFAGIWEY
jgi:putative SOS response-associated peptidase YedK